MLEIKETVKWLLDYASEDQLKDFLKYYFNFNNILSYMAVSKDNQTIAKVQLNLEKVLPNVLLILHNDLSDDVIMQALEISKKYMTTGGLSLIRSFEKLISSKITDEIITVTFNARLFAQITKRLSKSCISDVEDYSYGLWKVINYIYTNVSPSALKTIVLILLDCIPDDIIYKDIAENSIEYY